MRLTRFAQTLDQWAAACDPLLRATAIDAREKLRHAARGSRRASTRSDRRKEPGTFFRVA
jgi:hypothetical protein